MDADHVLKDLEDRFDNLLEFLEKHKDWKRLEFSHPS